MIKHQAILEIQKSDRIYQLHLLNDSPLGEIFDVLTEMRVFVLNRLNEASKSEVKTEELPKEKYGD